MEPRFFECVFTAGFNVDKLLPFLSISFLREPFFVISAMFLPDDENSAAAGHNY